MVSKPSSADFSSAARGTEEGQVNIGNSCVKIIRYRDREPG